jgi:nucleoside-diphosphate-sugar epimerase
MASDAWSGQLEGVETVVHLAAATGKVRRQEQLEVNLEGSRRLLELARRAGVRRFLFVSSIAVTYRNRPYYHYAETKAAAEALVCNAELDWLIVRPTMVLGPGSPTVTSLRRLARLPVPLLFGKGDQLVQPIHVDDLARMLVAALALERWGGRLIETGGPETVTLEALMARIRAADNQPARRFRHLPLGPVRMLFGSLEPVFFSLLPFTAGQLAPFANPSVAAPDPLLAQLPAPSLGIAEMLGEA